MEIIFVMIPASLLLALIGVLAYIWAVRTGQYEDLDTPALRILHEDLPEQTKVEDKIQE